ncbi:MAG: PIN domain-containing protein [Thermoplasmatales archaeon]|nr:PIN domain-containing protein [Thermoplasmatales archaeon]
MNREKIYLDTTVPSAYYDERQPHRRKVTCGWWDNEIRNFSVVISELTRKELSAVTDSLKKKKLLALVNKFEIVKITAECERLAREYVKHKILSERNFADALHIAISSVCRANILVSWNFKHIVNYKTRCGIRAINLLNHYPEIYIATLYELGGEKYE